MSSKISVCCSFKWDEKDNIVVNANTLKIAASVVFLGLGLPVLAAPAAPITYAVPAETASYADIADLVVIAPVIIDAKIRNVKKVPAEQALGVPVNMQRLLVEADVQALIRGTGGITPRVRFVLDLAKDARGKLPSLNKQRLFLMAQYTNVPGNIKLARPDALIQWSAGNDALLRAITKEAVQIDAPAQITGIGNAFHNPGTLLGDGETQIFLKTANNQPMALTVLSQQAVGKRWSVSTSELIDETSSAPKRDTLLWYRLACGLPKRIADAAFETDDAKNRSAAQADYVFVLKSLGPCGRQRPLPLPAGNP
jgi:hypothetical protein